MSSTSTPVSAAGLNQGIPIGDPIDPPVPSKWKKVWEVTKKVAIIAALVLVGVGLFWLNPSFFCVGFVLGFIFSAKVLEVSKDVVNTAKNLSTWQKVGVAAGLIVCGALALPTTMATISVLYASYWGAQLREVGTQNMQELHA